MRIRNALHTRGCLGIVSKTGSHFPVIKKSSSKGSRVAEWLVRRTCNPEIVGSSPALTTKLELSVGRP